MTTAMRRIDRFVIHTAATPLRSLDISAAAIKAYHLATLGWKTAGYHFVIRKDGRVEPLVPVSEASNGVKGLNAHSVHICCSGNGDIEDFTPAQKVSLVRLIVRLAGEHNVSKAIEANPMRVLGHRECYQFAGVPNTGKTCPGTKVDMKQIRKLVLEAL